MASQLSAIFKCKHKQIQNRFQSQSNHIEFNRKERIWQRDPFKRDPPVEHSLKFKPDLVDPEAQLWPKGLGSKFADN